tara:strand:- start:686 stop:1327 length:642 start_codon:yes stop_codon:yes gene_type:complete
MTTTSIVLGSSGLIGAHLLHELKKKDTNIVAVMRRSEKNLPKKIIPLVIDFDDFIENGVLPECDHLYICLGTTIKKAGSKVEFRRIDLDYCLAFAKKAKESGASKISVVTSIGANAKSSNFYLQTKGLLEEEIKKLGFDSVCIFQPGLLLGKRKENRPLEKISQKISFIMNIFLVGRLRIYKSVKAHDIAHSMANHSLSHGIKILRYDDFKNT